MEEFVFPLKTPVPSPEASDELDEAAPDGAGAEAEPDGAGAEAALPEGEGELPDVEFVGPRPP